MAECEHCNSELQHPRDKDNAGYWRPFCMDCTEEIANERDPAGKIELGDDRV